MTAQDTRRMRVVVCGARFGQVYLEAFRAPDLPFELAGVLANGSERSRACARFYGVPLYRRPDDLPDDIDIACVVIRGGLLGGRGAELAQALMSRGIHVLQEHPLHHDELAACLRTARRNKVIYQLNSFYVHVAPVRRFLAAARELLRRQPARYVDAACGFQLAYSLLDILGQALGGVRPWGFPDLPELPPDVRKLTELDVPFRGLDGVLAGVPVTLRVQNQMDPADPDNYAHLMHRVTIGTEAGNLTLVGTHGPIVWSARPDFPREVAGTAATPHFDAHTNPYDGTSATVIGPGAVPDYLDVFRTMWPAGVGHALRDLRAAIEAGDDPLRRGQYHLTLCQLWQDITARIGPPELLHAPPPRPLTAGDVRAMADAAQAAVDGTP
ncbi:MAG TPA: Gfo/Idh/MocA family oxidoreductase [Pilimelia sp.]|nr:Gfo/Idh/MocA family oxidoreductase [Pilimelia sp.]